MSSAARTCCSLVVLLVLAAWPAAAGAMAPGAPSGPVGTSFPLFQWTGAGETATAIYVATSPAVEVDGTPVPDSLVVTGTPDAGATSWRPLRPIAAGSYWWVIGYFTATGESAKTAPAAFSVRPLISKPSVTIEQSRSRPALAVRASWTNNVRKIAVTCVVRDGGTRVARYVERQDFAMIEGRDSIKCPLRVPERLDGERLSVTVTVAGGGGSSARTVRFTAR